MMVVLIPAAPAGRGVGACCPGDAARASGASPRCVGAAGRRERGWEARGVHAGCRSPCSEPRAVRSAPGREPRHARGADSPLVVPTLPPVPDTGPFTRPVQGSHPLATLGLLLTWPILPTKRGDQEAGVVAGARELAHRGRPKPGSRPLGLRPHVRSQPPADGARPTSPALSASSVRLPGLSRGWERLGSRLP